MRVYALYILTFVLIAWSMRTWFVGACGLLAMSLLLEHPDYPNEVLGVNGANPWNMLFICTVLAWMMQRPYESPAPPMSRTAKLAIGAFIAALTFVCAISAVNMTAPPATGLTVKVLILDYYLNPLKILFLAYLVYEGANTPKRQTAVLGCIVVSALITAMLVLKYRLSTGLSSDFMRGRQRLGKEVGLHANQLGWVLAGTFWGMLAMAGLWKRKLMRFLTVAAAGIPALAVMVVQSRAGYLAMAATGLLFGLVRWRKLLLLLPAGAIAIMVFLPSVSDRMLMGVETAGSPIDRTEYDIDTITAGRPEIWAPMVEVIQGALLIGEGRVAILRTPARAKIEAAIGICPSHPHNAFLEMLADGGIVGTLMMLGFYAAFFMTVVRLFRIRWSPLSTAVGGLALALLASRLVTGVSGCSFFPTRSMFGMFAMGGLALRVASDYAHRRAGAPAPMTQPATSAYPVRFVPSAVAP